MDSSGVQKFGTSCEEGDRSGESEGSDDGGFGHHGVKRRPRSERV